MSEKPPTRQELADRLLKLSREMIDLSVCMDYYGGFSAMAKRSRELSGAGFIVRKWVREINEDEEVPL